MPAEHLQDRPRGTGCDREAGMPWDKPAISQERKPVQALLQADGEGCRLGGEVATGHYEKTWP